MQAGCLRYRGGSAWVDFIGRRRLTIGFRDNMARSPNTLEAMNKRAKLGILVDWKIN